MDGHKAHHDSLPRRGMLRWGFHTQKQSRMTRKLGCLVHKENYETGTWTKLQNNTLVLEYPSFCLKYNSFCFLEKWGRVTVKENSSEGNTA